MPAQSDAGPYGIAPHSGTFGQVPAQLIFDQRISAEAVRVYAALACHADHQGYCYPKQVGLARAIGCSQQTLSHHLAALADPKNGAWITPGWTVVDGHRRHCYCLRFQPTRTNGVDTAIPARTNGVDIDGVDIDGVDIKNIPVYEHTLRGNSGVWERGEEEHIGAAPAAAPRGGADALRFPPEAEPLYHSLTHALRAWPRTDPERKAWGKVLRSLTRAGVEPEDVPRLMRRWSATFPQARCTIFALDKWLGTIDPTPAAQPPTDTAVTVPSLPAVRTPPTYEQWITTLPLNEQALYMVNLTRGQQNYRLYCRERGMEPQP